MKLAILICLSHLFERFYTQLSGPGIEFAIIISFIKLRSALKLIGSQGLVENGFNCNKKIKELRHDRQR